ncbi:hypothetical protein DERP_007399 [Dermatophagoides pteronyssinus]|uniref:SHSP domain-containing protein n=1 Tax=Dermatophagoides pteronyssinus TaxID=6956 RepID=A0ABQ8J4K4_DERPT|nr:hypothetical protein DERP_007399 [Dermatophagoides pteronyssinus]
MIIISQVEPIIEPIFENEFWYLPTRASASARAASMIGLMNQSQSSLTKNHGQIPPFEYNGRYLQYFGLPQFQPDDIKIKMDRENRQITISGRHEQRNEWEFESYEFNKRILIPADVDMKNMKCFIAENGLIQIEAPMLNRSQQQQMQTDVEKEIPIQFKNSKQNMPKQTTGGRMIPIEHVVGRQPIQEESFCSKQTEQLERGKRSHKSPTPPATTIIQPPPPPPDAIRQMIREIPIRMARRPIDQGILCPCCHGRGSRSSSSSTTSNCGFDHQNYPQLVAYRQNPQSSSDSSILKKDYQPKNHQNQTTTTTKAIRHNNKNQLQAMI